MTVRVVWDHFQRNLEWHLLKKVNQSNVLKHILWINRLTNNRNYFYNITRNKLHSYTELKLKFPSLKAVGIINSHPNPHTYFIVSPQREHNINISFLYIFQKLFCVENFFREICVFLGHDVLFCTITLRNFYAVNCFQQSLFHFKCLTFKKILDFNIIVQ